MWWDEERCRSRFCIWPGKVFEEGCDLGEHEVFCTPPYPILEMSWKLLGMRQHLASRPAPRSDAAARESEDPDAQEPMLRTLGDWYSAAFSAASSCGRRGAQHRVSSVPRRARLLCAPRVDKPY